MQNYSINIRRLVVGILNFLAILSLLSLVCAVNPDLPSGVTFGQWTWFVKTILGAACCTAVAVLLQISRNQFWGNLISFPYFARYVAWSLMLLGGVEAVWGLRQLYGFSVSGHSLYNLTGSFYNPGPYGGYLAMVLPVCLHYYASPRGKWKEMWWYEKIGKLLAVVTGILILCVLPATMSRSAWIAALLSCGWVMYMFASKKYKKWVSRKSYRKGTVRWVGGMLALLLIGGGIGMFRMKSDSALGRVFLWRMTCQAIMQHPFVGTSTPAVSYSDAQETYFAKGTYATWEERVAGSPKYAFNEYLEIWLEWGLFLLLVLCWLAGVSIWQGIRGHNYGLCGAIISLLIFCFSSYPFQFPAFIITMILLLLACSGIGALAGRLILFVVTILALAFNVTGYNDNKMEAYRNWSNAKILYHAGAYESAEKSYLALMPDLSDEASFLFEYGHCLHKTGDYEESTRILKRAGQYSTDPMILNVIGKNYQQEGKYEEAEKVFIRATHRLPGRIYPYYLLAKLYAEPGFLHPDKFVEMQRIVMTKEPKVSSTAIRQMREELEKLSANIVIVNRSKYLLHNDSPPDIR
jgi:tetratricopeptide (TPR) repeat protein